MKVFWKRDILRTLKGFAKYNFHKDIAAILSIGSEYFKKDPQVIEKVLRTAIKYYALDTAKVIIDSGLIALNNDSITKLITFIYNQFSLVKLFLCYENARKEGTADLLEEFTETKEMLQTEMNNDVEYYNKFRIEANLIRVPPKNFKTFNHLSNGIIYGSAENLFINYIGHIDAKRLLQNDLFLWNCYKNSTESNMANIYIEIITESLVKKGYYNNIDTIFYTMCLHSNQSSVITLIKSLPKSVTWTHLLKEKLMDDLKEPPINLLNIIDADSDSLFYQKHFSLIDKRTITNRFNAKKTMILLLLIHELVIGDFLNLSDEDKPSYYLTNDDLLEWSFSIIKYLATITSDYTKQFTISNRDSLDEAVNRKIKIIDTNGIIFKEFKNSFLEICRYIFAVNTMCDVCMTPDYGATRSSEVGMYAFFWLFGLTYVRK